MGWINDSGARRGWALLISAALGVILWSAPAFAQYPQFRNTVMYASSVFLAGSDNERACGEVTTPVLTNDDFSITPKPSTLFRIDDPLTGAATEVGPIQDPNLAGRTILSWLGPQPVLPLTQSIQDWVEITLSPTESLLDVCGLAGANGKLYGTATLAETRIHVLIEIDPDTAEATLIESLRIDKGIFQKANIDDESKADPTACLVMDLDYVPHRGRLVALGSCMYREPTLPPELEDPLDPSITVRTAPLLQRTQLSYIDPATGHGQEAAGVPKEPPYDTSINERPFTPATVAYRASTDTLSGTVVLIYVHYNERGGLNFPAQRDAGLFNPPAPELDDDVSVSEAYLPLSRIGVLLTGKTTAMAYRPNPEQLYRTILDADATSNIEPIDWQTGQPAGPVVPLTYSGGDVMGIQAIAFVDYPDYSDQLTGAPTPLNQLVACAPTPRGAAQCNVASASTRGSGLRYYLDKMGTMKLKMYRGSGLTRDDFGAPDVDTNYALCIYGDDSTVGGDDPLATGDPVTLLSGRQLPAPWKVNKRRSKFRYKVKSPYTSVYIKYKSAGYAIIKVKAKEFNFPPQPLSVGGVTVQLVDSNGQCWSAEFPNGTWLQNSVTRFTAGAP